MQDPTRFHPGQLTAERNVLKEDELKCFTGSKLTGLLFRYGKRRPTTLLFCRNKYCKQTAYSRDSVLFAIIMMSMMAAAGLYRAAHCQQLLRIQYGKTADIHPRFP
jgi:hypothetical protein